jgi:hypothetical protein
MGAWGSGNFENDTAADHLSELTSRLVNEIAEAMEDPSELAADEYWGNAVPCNLEILNLIASKKWAGTLLPEPDRVEEWKAIYMSVWEESIDDLDVKPAFKKQRHKKLLKTFNELLAHAQDQHADD